ncbi:DUF6653 family protein [Pseudovibrio sp. SPO723]|uniref:DUF6653 family protein n=1 Tax=Nesiotobacter zosterae TaxID=392721 RepID=UPI0029C3ECB2|nr:DUF6653 family protein [Pseudovibrio sp. SPO723]MDX5592625.1 DUF6653 family protein [Pseudovibrio sp. SPO723]
MNDRTWERQASGWSVWSRAATLPVLVAAIWLHTTVGWMWSTAMLLAVVFWLWANPRLFNPPRHTDTWHAKATFGERIWLNQRAVPIPAKINGKAIALSLLSGLGFLMAIIGAVGNEITMTIAGVLLTYGAKFTFLNVMVKLYGEMQNAHPVYKSWLRTPENDNSPTTAKKTNAISRS